MGSFVLKPRIKYSKPAANLSVVIIALNEEKNLSSLLPEIPEGAEVILVDSNSSDQTVGLATSYGAKVFQRAFDNYSSQKNYAMSLATCSWVLCLDADERPDEKLWDEILTVVSSPADNKNKIFTLQRSLIFLGRKMRFGRTHDAVKRLFPAKSVEYENEIHESVRHHAHAEIIRLKGILWHESYKNLDDYFVKFNRYTTMMANARFKNKRIAPQGAVLALRIPVDFTVRYFLKLGFLDGWQGFLWAMLGTVYGFVKYAKLIEMQQNQQKFR